MDKSKLPINYDTIVWILKFIMTSNEGRTLNMSKIVNEAKIKNKLIVKIRELLDHRAFWLYLLVDEAEKRGLDPEDFASAAITRCGLSQGSDLVKQGVLRVLKA